MRAPALAGNAISGYRFSVMRQRDQTYLPTAHAPHRIVGGILGFFATCAGAHMIIGKKPWKLGIQQRLEAGKFPKLEQFVDEGLWYAAAACLIISLVLLVTRRLWLIPWQGGNDTFGAFLRTPSAGRRWFAAVIVALTTLSAWDRLPKLGQSFGTDEEYAFRRLVHGVYVVGENGKLEFEPATWKDTLFNNRASHNHIAFTALSRVSHEIHRFMVGGDPSVSEFAVRAPAYVAGVLSIPAIALLLAVTGYARAGVVAACLLALHPWHLRYATEARGYSLMLLFFVLGLMALAAALETGRWRWWLLFGLSQGLVLLAFPGAIYLVATINLGALAVILTRHRMDRPSLCSSNTLPAIARLAVANVGGAMVFIALFAPSVRQLGLFMDGRAAQGSMGFPWLRDLWAHLFTGMRWHMDDPSKPIYLSLQHTFETYPYAEVILGALLPLTILAGLVRTLRDRGTAILLVAPSLCAVLLAFAHISVAGKFLYVWYVLYGVVGVVAGAGLGAEWAFRLPWCRPFLPNVAGALACGLLVVSYFQLTAYPRGLLRAHPRQPMREAVEAAHAGGHLPFDPEGSKILTASIGTSARHKISYAPRMIPLKTADAEALPQVHRLMEEAEALDVPLRIVIGNPAKVEREAPETFALLSGASDFTILAEFDGLEEMFSYRVAEYMPRGSREEPALQR